MKFVLYAKGSRGLAVTQALFEKNLQPTAIVIEKHDDLLVTLASQYRVTLQECAYPKQLSHISWLKECHPNLILAAGYSKILPEEILEIPSLGAINCHGGRLPFYRGASPIPWQIIQGETEGEAYVLIMTTGIDDGPILASEKYPIGENETAKDITARVNDIFARLVPNVVEQYAKGESPTPWQQPTGQACIWTRRYPRDGLIHWHEMTAKDVVNLVRALDEPYPGAFTYCRGQKIIITKATLHPTMIRGVPGRFVGYRDGLLTILARNRAIGVLSFSVNGQSNMPFPAKYGDDMQNSVENSQRENL